MNEDEKSLFRTNLINLIATQKYAEIIPDEYYNKIEDVHGECVFDALFENDGSWVLILCYLFEKDYITEEKCIQFLNDMKISILAEECNGEAVRYLETKGINIEVI